MKREAVIIGAGPAGLTAAYELLRRTDILPVVLEATGDIGGISRTVNHRGNRIDIGGHRFFSRSTRVMDWWLDVLPLQGAPARDDRLLNREVPLSSHRDAPDPEVSDEVMLTRTRLSRILFQRRLFDYPLSLNTRMMSMLGLRQVARIGTSYLAARVRPVQNETSLEDFLINRFGRELYLIFFKDYTEKVWGVSCREISSEWGAQRIKGLSVRKAVADAARNLFSKGTSRNNGKTETTLIRRFLYPKFGPGQMWEQVAALIRERGGQIHLNHEVIGVKTSGNKVVEVHAMDHATGRLVKRSGDYVFSTMPVKQLVGALGDSPPPAVRQVSEGLAYRDFLTVGLLLPKLRLKNESGVRTVNGAVPDNWIYIQERDVKVGRIQVFNNWSPYMVRDPQTVWMGLEYFCAMGDSLWNLSDAAMTAFAVEELKRIDVIGDEEILDSCVIRVPYAYPAYFGAYAGFPTVRAWLDRWENLFLIGRNGMHRYNNQDHSMLAAMTAVENILEQRLSKDNVWAVNAEDEYHEER